MQASLTWAVSGSVDKCLAEHAKPLVLDIILVLIKQALAAPNTQCAIMKGVVIAAPRLSQSQSYASALTASWVGIVYLMEEEWASRGGTGERRGSEALEGECIARTLTHRTK
ncbi:hypothetical protein EVAR_21903_1 [Eumeta japonica]|uniref:Uncharacterized protein n=1 Tax=Eumeta variegata TaxID=151549 RepID=A0A4C1XF26_EUMVA|nr:hypothetical protein EVAR_21903_1 [Eumeta japonica]